VIQRETVDEPKALNAAPHDRASVEPIFKRFRECAHRTNHPVLELFRDFDRFNNGSVAEGKFASALAKTGLVFSKREMEVMREFFGDPRRPECVNYMELCRAVAENGEDSCGLGSVPMTYQEEVEVGHIVRRWTDYVEQKRWPFRRLFSGCQEALMKLKDFREKIAAVGVFVKSDEWHLVVRKYRGNSVGDIDWARFVADSEKRQLF
jgi:hypothetical protein